jgi:two-component system, response regulator YesN
MNRKLEVVVVDDEVQITELLKTFLLYADREIKIHTFNDSMVAKDFISHNPVDMLITDYKMPGFNGLQLMESAPRQIRKIIISGDDSWINEQELRNLNATFFEKPISLRALTKIISEEQEILRS